MDVHIPITDPRADRNLSIVVGRLVADAVPGGTDADRLSFDLRVKGPDGSETVPVTWSQPPARLPRLAPGDRVAVVGRTKKRFYRSGPRIATYTDVVADGVAVARRAEPVEALLRRAIALVADPTG